MAEEQGWQNSAELRERVRNMFSTIGRQTGVVENAFQAERGEEELRNYNRRMSKARRWSTLLQRHCHEQVPVPGSAVLELRAHPQGLQGQGHG